MRGRDFSISFAVLRTLSQLIDCPQWGEVVFLGRVDYRAEQVTYDGGVVQYKGMLYYVNKAQIDFGRALLRWDVHKSVAVVE